MPLTTFNPSIRPTSGSQFAPKVNVLKAEFGDGYTQGAPNGLNHIKETISLKWDGLTEAQLIELRTVFEERGGYQPFYYQPRGFSSPLKWICEKWGFSDSAPWRFDAKLEQHFTTES